MPEPATSSWKSPVKREQREWGHGSCSHSRVTQSPPRVSAVVSAEAPSIMAAGVAALTAWHTGNILAAMLLAMGTIRTMRQLLV